jgi:hypothetical protein
MADNQAQKYNFLFFYSSGKIYCPSGKTEKSRKIIKNFGCRKNEKNIIF